MTSLRTMSSLRKSQIDDLATQASNDDILGEVRTPPEPAPLRLRSALPSDAVVIIEPDLTGELSGGRARKGRWQLRFRERTCPFVDPLMGWTGGSDPLTHVRLVFPSREAAEGYCTRYGLPFEVRLSTYPTSAELRPARKAIQLHRR